MIELIHRFLDVLPTPVLMPVLAATIVFGAVGTLILPGVGTLLGAAIGGLIDQYILFPLLFPPDPIKGPRLNELRVQGVDHGSPKNICFGEATRCAGALIWTSNLIEIKDVDEEGVLLNKTRIVKYRYFVHLDVSICDNEVESIDKIWANEKVIYIRTPEEEEIIEEHTFSITAQTETSPIVSPIVFPSNTGDIEGTAVPGSNTTQMVNLDADPVTGQLFTVAGDTTEYVVSGFTKAGAIWTVEFSPVAQTQFDDGDNVTMLGFTMRQRYMTLHSTDPVHDLTVFGAGQVTVSGATHAGNNGTFTVVKANKDGGNTSLKLINQNAAAQSAGPIITVSQVPPSISPRLASAVRIYTGTQSQMPDPLTEAIEGVGLVPAYRGEAHVVFELLRLEDFGDQIPQFSFLVRERTGRTLGQTIEMICLRAGMAKTDIDVSALQSTVMKGYTIKGPKTTLEALQPLLIRYDVVIQQRNGVLHFFFRKDSPQVPVPPAELGCYTLDEAPPNEVEVSDVRQNDIPNTVKVRFSDPARDYQAGTQVARMNFHSVEAPAVVDLDLTMNADEAREVAERALWSLHANRYKLKIMLPPSRATLREYDTLQIAALGKNWTPMIEKIDRGENWLVEVNGIQEDLTTRTQSAIADPELGFPGRDQNGFSNPNFNSILPSAATPNLQIIDIAPLAAGDETELGFYMSGAMYDSAAPWNGAIVYESADGGITYGPKMELFVEAIQGRCTTALGSSGADGYHWDRKNTVTVDLDEGALVSRTEAEVMDGKNWAVCGEEVIGFKTATLVSGTTWTLSTLLRGRRNTEIEITKHKAEERFVVLDNMTGVELYPMNASQVGVTRTFKPIPDAGDLTTLYPETVHTLQGNTMRCFAPHWLRASRTSSGDLTLNWVYRSRAISKLFGPAAAPQLEPSEKYEVDFYNTLGTVVLRTKAVEGATTVGYSAAEQTADGLTPGAAVKLRLYQMSAVLGRGRPLIETV